MFGLDGETPASSLTLHHLMRGWALFDLPLILPYTQRESNKDSSTPALNATAETDRSVDGQITPHPAALSLFPSASLLRAGAERKVSLMCYVIVFVYISKNLQIFCVFIDITSLHRSCYDNATNM